MNSPAAMWQGPIKGGERLMSGWVRIANGTRSFILIVAVILMLWSMVGCSSIGPSTLRRDRFDYITAISDSWKQQLLLNVVKMRYADTPVFLDVGQVISGYELESTISASGTLSAASNADLVNLGGEGRYLDRPTVTYAPLTGANFIKTMMTPVPPGAIMFLVESGWPVDFLLQVSVQAINGLRNQKGGAFARPADSEFIEVVRLLSRIQAAGGIGFKVQRETDDKEASMLLFHTRHLTPQVLQDVAEVRRLLRLDPEATHIIITYGADAQSDHEIALHTRSAYQVLIELASLVTVPPQHIEERRTVGAPPVGEGPTLPQMVVVHSGTKRAADTFTQIKYRDHWYWVDDRDFRSKRTFTFLTVLFTLSETGQMIQQPILTIRAN